MLKDWDYPELPEVAGYHVSWVKYSEPITADLIVWANYAVAPHTVTFVADGVTVKTMEVEDGYVLTDGDYPAVPEKEGYWGTWNVQTAPITQDMTIRAVYRLAHMHTVTFVASGKTVKTLSVPDGYTLKSSDYPEVPPKTGYDGKWNQYTSPVTADITIQAVYTPGTPVPTLPTDPGDLMSLEDEAPTTEPTTEENPEDLELAASEEVAATSSSPAMILVSTVTEQHSYIYAGRRLLRETITTTAADGTITVEILDFAYNAQGAPYSLTYTKNSASPVTYYYITNLQGDVMRLIDSAGETKATYSYDPYGQVLRANGAMAEINPLQYRGYYYESETGFYYLQSRYYNPVICRFVSSDKYASTGQGYLGYNMFTYCNNNPVNSYDPAGCRAMGPSFVYCNDGGYASQYIVPPKTQKRSQEPTPESQVLDYYVENDYAQVLNESEDAISVQSYVAHLGTYTIDKGGRVMKSGIIGGAASGIAAKVLGSLASGFVAGVAVSILAACLDNSPPAGTYDLYAIVSYERYKCTKEQVAAGYVWRDVVRCVGYIDINAVDGQYEWYCVGNVSAHETLVGPGFRG